MRESERRINEYKKILPHIQMKVASIAFMLIISVVMMTAATFAWLTVSKSPEVAGIQTTVSANGNLEIALSRPNGEAPLASEIGDAKKELLARNMTWGNLVNLSDASYGLETLELRPAVLNTSSLLDSPLFAASYGNDGRVEGLTSAFAYTNFDPNEGVDGAFIVPSSVQYGVRAVSSVTYSAESAHKVYLERLQDAENRLSQAKNDYAKLTSNKDYLSSITGIIGIYLTDKFNESTSDYKKYIPKMYEMMSDFDKCMDLTGDAIVSIANLQSYMKNGAAAKVYTIDTLLAESDTELATNGVSISGLAGYKTDLETFNSYMATMETIHKSVVDNNASVYWSSLSDIVNYMAHIDSVLIVAGDFKKEVKNIGKSDAVGLLNEDDIHAVIQKGALYNSEVRLGSFMYAVGMEVSVRYMISVTLEATVYTAANPAYATIDYEVPSSLDNVGEPDNLDMKAVAADTYGMAIDIWVRSNAADDYLILEGQTLTKEIQKTDAQGNPYYICEGVELVKRPVSDNEYHFYTEAGDVVLVLKITKNSDGIETSTYYSYDEEGNLVEYTPELSIAYETVVYGYEGENRVWDDEALSENLSTQGAGSCYVFYTDTPQQQAQSMDLLEKLTIAFIDEEGKLLSYADLDTDSYYAENGKVTVPLVVRNTGSNAVTITDESGISKTYSTITPLEKGKEKRITALMYVDGSTIDNSEVLADSNLQGQFNIQFGSLSDMEAIKDQTLQSQEIAVSATVLPREFDYANNQDVTVELSITGLIPSKATANFIRKINDTQGTRQEEIIFVPAGDGKYTTTVHFDSPGEYVLRSVYLDGIEYELLEPQTVTIAGFGISSVGWTHEGNFAKILSADSYHTEDLTVSFGSNSYVPSKVQGIFSNENNQTVTVNFKKGTSNWAGSAKFSASGNYVLQYLVIDGEYWEIPTTMQKTLDLTLGMKATVQISETNMMYLGELITVDVYAEIKDNSGEPQTNLENVSIVYYQQGSSLFENGLSSTLTWDASQSKYVGKFDINRAGAFQFGYIDISGSRIMTADAPTVQAKGEYTPAYFKNLTEDTLFAYGTEVAMKVVLEKSDYITNGDVIATMVKTDGDVTETYQVAGTSSNYSNAEGEDIIEKVARTWNFALPTMDSEGNPISLVGQWQMTQLDVIGAYISDGVYSTAEEPLTFDVSDENITTTVNSEMIVTIGGDGVELGSLLFNTEAVVSDPDALNVTIQSTSGETVMNADSVKVYYTLSPTYYDGSSSYVGYTSSSTSAVSTYQTVSATLIPDPSGGSYYVLNEAGNSGVNSELHLLLAGLYEFSKVEVMLGGTTYSADLGNSDETAVLKISENSVVPSFEFAWIAPEVTVTGVDPAKGTSFMIADGASGSNDYSTYSATVYHKTERKEGTCGSVSYPYIGVSSVTTALTQGGNYTTALMTVQGSTSVTFEYSKVAGSDVASDTRDIGTTSAVLGNGQAKYITVNGTVGNNNQYAYVFELRNAISITNTK